MIDGVVTKLLKVMPDERGRLMEILRNDDDVFTEFGQVYMTTTYPGVVKAWHYHKGQEDLIACIKGMIKLVLYDNREGSPTRGEVNEFYIGDHRPMLVLVPRMIYHGWKCVSGEEAFIVNAPNTTYNYKSPDEFRVDPHNNDIPYNWERKDG